MTDFAFADGVPIWIELGTTDIDAAAAFYGPLFGWTVQDMGPETGGYRILLKDGKQVAGMGAATDAARGTSWAVYLGTHDVEATAAAVGKHGGTVVQEPTDVMDLGRMAVCQDPTGAYFSLWQPLAHRGSDLRYAPGALRWAEVFSTDLPAVTTFYEEVFGLRHEDQGLSDTMLYRIFFQGDAAAMGSMQITEDMGGMSPTWAVYFQVEDLDGVADAAIAAGATQLMRDDVPVGRVAWLTDPQGGVFCLMQPDSDFTM